MLKLLDNDYRVVGPDSNVHGRFDSPYSALEFLKSSLLAGSQRADLWVVVDHEGQVLAKAIDALEAA